MYRLALSVLVIVIAPWACLGKQEERILYDFWSNESPSEVLKSFKDVKTLQSFKVYGIGRYLIVVKNDQSDNMKNLRMPKDSYNTKAIPMEKLSQFYRHFSSSSSDDDDDSTVILPDNDLTFVEVNRTLEYNEKEVKGIMREESETLSTRDTRNMDVYVATASQPLKYIYFMSRNDYDTTELFLKDADRQGGYRRLQISVQKIHKI